MPTQFFILCSNRFCCFSISRSLVLNARTFYARIVPSRCEPEHSSPSRVEALFVDKFFPLSLMFGWDIIDKLVTSPSTEISDSMPNMLALYYINFSSAALKTCYFLTIKDIFPQISKPICLFDGKDPDIQDNNFKTQIKRKNQRP